MFRKIAQPLTTIVVLAGFALVVPHSPMALAGGKPNIVILATGGTIAGTSADSSTEYDAAQLKMEELLQAIPEASSMADLSWEQISQVGSQDMSEEIWLRLAVRCSELLSRNSVDGIVITHGTDTIEETAFFLSLTNKSDKPIVLTAAMRPADSLSADGPRNLRDALIIATSHESKGRGPLVVINEEVHAAMDVTKTHTTSVSTFRSPNVGPVGSLVNGKPHYRRGAAVVPSDIFYISPRSLKGLPRVDIVYMYAGADSKIVDYLAAQGAQGFIIAGVGNGNSPKSVLESMSRLSKTGITFVRSSRVGSGRVDRNIEINDDEMDFVASSQLNPQKSRILLSLALAKNKSRKELQDLYLHLN